MENTEPQPPQPQAWQGYEVKKKKSKKPLVIGGIVVGLVLCCGGVVSAVVNSDSGKKGLSDGRNGAKAVATSAAPTKGNSKKPDPLPTKGAHVPTVKDIVLKVKVTKKQCFGSAGCLVDFRIDTLTYTGEDMDKNQAYEVIYEVKGLKDPYTNTLTLNGDGSFEFEKEESGQTATTKVALKAVVSSVDEKL